MTVKLVAAEKARIYLCLAPGEHLTFIGYLEVLAGKHPVILVIVKAYNQHIFRFAALCVDRVICCAPGTAALAKAEPIAAF